MDHNIEEPAGEKSLDDFERNNMSFYKACKSIQPHDTIIIHNFMKGVHTSWNIYKELETKPLALGFNKYNDDIMNKYKTLQKDFRCLISIQSMLINLIEEYVPNSKGKVRNIWRVLHAQKGTIDYYSLLIKALRKYKIQHQNIYDALKHDINKDIDRIKRNTEFIDSTMQDCGLSPLISVIAEEFHETIFENAKKFCEDFYKKESSIIIDSNDFFKMRDNAYIEYIKSIAINHNIDLSETINQAENNAKQQASSIKQSIKQSKHEQRMIETNEKAIALNQSHNAILYNAVENGNVHDLIPKKSYSNLLTALQSMNGECYYITCTFGGPLYFYTYINDLSNNMSKIAYFADKNDNRINAAISMLKQKNENAVISLECISHDAYKNTENSIVSMATAEEIKNAKINKFVKNIDNNINTHSIYHEMALHELSLLCNQQNTHDVYYIALYTDKCIFGFQYPQQNGKIETESLSKIVFSTDEMYIDNLIHKYSNKIEYKQYDFIKSHVTYKDTEYWNNIVKDEIAEYKTKLLNSLEEFDIDYEYKMTSASTHNLLRNLYNTYSHVSILIRKSLHHDPDIFCGEKCELHDCILQNSKKIPESIFRNKFKNNVIISTSEQDDMLLQKIIDDYSSTDTKHVYAILDLQIDN